MRYSNMAYLASPYSHTDPAVKEDRFQYACRAAAALLRKNEMVFSPIAHTHPIAKYGLPDDWAFWRWYDSNWIGICSEMIVLQLPGWSESVGVTAEIRFMMDLNKPVRYLNPTDIMDIDLGSPAWQIPLYSG